MSTSVELDQMFQKSIRLLHSSQPSSATELRIMLDELIKQRYGPEKMLCSTLNKCFLDEENNFPGMIATPSPSQQQQQQPANESDEVINLTHSPDTTIADSDDNMSSGGAAGSVSGAGMGLTSSAEEDTNLKEFTDLNCCVCNEMVFTATKRLIECSKCNLLYHQECHKPPITDEEVSEDRRFSWQCDSCCSKPTTTRAAGIVVVDEPMPLVTKTKSSAASSRSSSSSNSSSPFHKQENIASGSSTATSVITSAAQQQTTTQPSTSSSSSSSSKHHHHHHHKSSSSSSHSSSKSSSKHHEGSKRRKT